MANVAAIWGLWHAVPHCALWAEAWPAHCCSPLRQSFVVLVVVAAVAAAVVVVAVAAVATTWTATKWPLRLQYLVWAGPRPLAAARADMIARCACVVYVVVVVCVVVVIVGHLASVCWAKQATNARVKQTHTHIDTGRVMFVCVCIGNIAKFTFECVLLFDWLIDVHVVVVVRCAQLVLFLNMQRKTEYCVRK